jgi:hypothetical protein
VLKKANAGQPSVSVDKTPGLLAVITHDFFLANLLGLCGSLNLKS